MTALDITGSSGFCGTLLLFLFGNDDCSRVVRQFVGWRW
jgi:hypothetical protein